MTRANQYSTEIRERTVRMVHEQESAHSSRWATIVSIAEKNGRTPETLRTVGLLTRFEGESRPKAILA